MSDSNAQEPTMEEILASIRRIISEDDAPAADAAPEAAPAAAAATPAFPAFEAAPEPEDDDVLELTETVAPPPAAAPAPPAAAPYTPPVFADTAASSQVMGDLDISFPPGPTAPAPRAAAPAPAFEPQPASAYAPDYGASVDLDEPLLSDSSADRAASYFGALGLGRHVPMPAEGRTLEHLVAELLRPVLKEWLDQHLPSIVEAKVQAEVERVSRRS